VAEELAIVFVGKPETVTALAAARGFPTLPIALKNNLGRGWDSPSEFFFRSTGTRAAIFGEETAARLARRKWHNSGFTSLLPRDNGRRKDDPAQPNRRRTARQAPPY
jgi:hypothetical protein